VWAPDSRQFAFHHSTAQGVELWVADAERRSTRILIGPRLSMARGRELNPTYTWMANSSQILVQLVPEGRSKSAPAAPQVPAGALMEEEAGSSKRAAVYGGNLQSDHDEALYEYYMPAQAALVDGLDGKQRPIGTPHIYVSLNPSPNGRYVLAVSIERPYSH